MLHIRHFSDERVEDLEQRDLAQTNGDDEHRSDSGIYGFQVEVDPSHSSPTVAYEFIREEDSRDEEEFQKLWNKVFPQDVEHIIPPDDPDGYIPVFKQVVSQQIKWMLEAEEILRAEAIKRMIVVNHVCQFTIEIPDRIIRCSDGTFRAYYDTVERVDEGFVLAVPARITYSRSRNGSLTQV